MNTRWVLIAFLAVLVGSAWLLASRFGSTPGPAGPLPSAAVRAAPTGNGVAQSELERAPANPEAERSAIAVKEDPVAAAETDAVAPRAIRGRVLDARALPMAGVELGFSAAFSSEVRARAVSTAGGWFELEAGRIEGVVRSIDPRFVTLMGGRVRPLTEVDPLVVVAPHVDVAGHVIDTHGAPLAAARVTLELPAGFRARFDAVFDSTEGEEWRVSCDEQGAFDLRSLAWVEGAQLVCELGGYESARVELPQASDLQMTITLARPAAAGALIGRVVDVRDTPVAGALVSLGTRSAVSDAAGEFQLDRAGAEDSFELVAMKAGHRLGRLRAGQDFASGGPLWPDYVVVALGGEPLVLAGTVVDQDGEPRERMRLWIDDPTPFGILGEDTHASAEYYLGAAADEDPVERSYWSAEHTDSQGRFRFEGMLEREYSLCVMNPDTLAVRSFGPFRAGNSSVRIVFEDEDLGSLSGRIVSRTGAGVPGVELELLGNAYGGVWYSAQSAVSDDGGRFLFEGVGGEALVISVSGDDVVPGWHAVDPPHGETTELEITVAVRCHFKVDLGPDKHRADALRVHDAQGQPMTLYQIGPGGSYQANQFPMVEGRSDSLGVDDRARTLILLKEGEQVLRVPIDLRPGQLNIVTPN